MSLPPLATEADLLARKVTIPAGVDADVLLDAGSAAIRDAAGTAITRSTVTLQLIGQPSTWLTIPVGPVRDIVAVSSNSVAVTDFVRVDQRLYRSGGWCSGRGLTLVEVTVDFGYDIAEADIVDLCCSLVAAQIAAMEDGYDPKRGLNSFRTDDYAESYARGDDEVINPLDLPDRTRDRLRTRFGIPAVVLRADQ